MNQFPLLACGRMVQQAFSVSKITADNHRLVKMSGKFLLYFFAYSFNFGLFKTVENLKIEHRVILNLEMGYAIGRQSVVWDRSVAFLWFGFEGKDFVGGFKKTGDR